MGSRVVIENSTAATPRLDDESFTRLLEAAYIMQQHQDRIRQKAATPSFPQIVAQVVELQKRIQTEVMNVALALNMVAVRLCGFLGAAGAAIAQVDQNQLTYLSATGTASLLAGSSISVAATSSSLCIRSGQLLKCPDTDADRRWEFEFCRKLGAKSFLAAPVFHDGKIAGAIELFFSKPNAFDDIAERTAELMAGLVAEIISKQAELELKQQLASERASVLLALEKLKPQLQKLAGDTATGDEAPAATAPQNEAAPALCRSCHQPLAADESSCGVCGESRVSSQPEGSESSANQWASLWEKQLVDEAGTTLPEVAQEHPKVAIEPSELDLESALAALEEKDKQASVVEAATESTGLATTDQSSQSAAAAAPTEEHLEWTSAQHTKEWLGKQVQQKPRRERIFETISARRGDVSLLLALLVFAGVLTWGFWPHRNANPVVPAASASIKRRHRPQPPQLALWEKALVALGLAVPPPAPEYMGNPNVNVWVDLQTGLYHCPGDPAYGTTPKGKYTSQHDAQQDQFEAAARKPCD